LTITGILKTEKRINPINRCPVHIVTTAEFERFRATYVTLFELAKERGVHHLKLKSELEGRGIKPALDQKSLYATFYRREAIDLTDQKRRQNPEKLKNPI